MGKETVQTTEDQLMKRDMPPAFIKSVCLSTPSFSNSQPYLLANRTTCKIMEMIPIISSDRLGFVKKKINKWRGVGGGFRKV